MADYDAFVLVSFGGPEGPADVIPFLENVTRGRGVPRERLAEVAHHYDRFGGVSPINQQCRDLLAAIASGTLCAVKTRGAPARAPGGSDSMAARVDSVKGPMKPEWLKKCRILSIRGAAGPTCARAFSMSSRYCRQLE